MVPVSGETLTDSQSLAVIGSDMFFICVFNPLFKQVVSLTSGSLCQEKHRNKQIEFIYEMTENPHRFHSKKNNYKWNCKHYSTFY